MRRNHRFPINGWDALEPRVALSAGLHHPQAHVSAQHQVPVATGPQSHHATVIVAQAFDQFRTMYFSTMNVYLTPPQNTAAGHTAFDNATVQEVNALAQNLIRGLLPVNGSTQRPLHGQPPIQTLINNRILASTPTSLNGGLKSASPPPGTTADGAQLYVATANGAITAAEGAVENSIGILRLGAFSGHN
jgi:hypothetical protein